MLYDLGPRGRRVYHALLDRIRSGQLAPGERLPSHTDLATAFGVAPLTVRQVLTRLEADHLLSRERGRGTFVRAPAGPLVLVVIADATLRAVVVDQVQRAGRRSMLALTEAEAVAALDREPSLALALVDLRLPAASDGLRCVRNLRRRRPDLPLVVLDPSQRQTTRLEHTVAGPLLILRHPLAGQLAHVLRTLATDVRLQPAGHAARTKRLDDVLDHYLTLQLRGDRASARAVLLKAMADGLSVADIYQGVLAPAQHRVGELWQRNQISVAREHLASAVTASVMAELAAVAPHAPSSGTRVLVACVEGELHDLGARMVADVLEGDGCEVAYLGANVPTDSVLAMIDEQPPGVLVLSATMLDRLVALREVVARVRATRDSGVRIAVGGQLVEWLPDVSRTIDVDLAARDALETLHFVRQIR